MSLLVLMASKVCIVHVVSRADGLVCLSEIVMGFLSDIPEDLCRNIIQTTFSHLPNNPV